MDIALQNQIIEQIRKSQKILIALPKNPNADMLGSSIALHKFLKKVGKEADIIKEGNSYGNLGFLWGIPNIKETVVFPETYIVSVKTRETKIAEVSYDETQDSLDIHLVPKSGRLTAADVSFIARPQSYDLIIFLDMPTLEHLGDLYAKNAEAFFNTTKLNIDNHIDNENYANINLIDITSASTSEILFESLKSWDKTLIDADMATALLLGIISETHSFQSSTTTPNSFLHASELIGLGADQQEIVRNLFKNKSLAMLKVFGRAMARIKKLDETGTIYTLVTSQDLARSEADQEDVLNAVHELIKNIPDLKLLFFAVETDRGLDLYLHSSPNIKFNEVLNHFGGQLIADFLGKAHLPQATVQNIQEILNQAMSDLRARLGL